METLGVQFHQLKNDDFRTQLYIINKSKYETLNRIKTGSEDLRILEFDRASNRGARGMESKEAVLGHVLEG